MPWIAIAAHLFGGDQAPAFVYAIFVSLFILFNRFAVNMASHFRRPGPWRDVVFSVKAYLVTSLAAKSALALQVFAGTLVG